MRDLIADEQPVFIAAIGLLGIVLGLLGAWIYAKAGDATGLYSPNTDLETPILFFFVGLSLAARFYLPWKMQWFRTIEMREFERRSREEVDQITVDFSELETRTDCRDASTIEAPENSPTLGGDRASIVPPSP